ncbi:hypothetical protein O181_085866 [Austropuccinia psidii MF-1]|uniref:AMP-dependent synthetase/ligase domain-containing protein n=1 Tax=Austropuccinia psidii MF-1 TaxID=1389203 RepID=A0A9Q3FTS8_9BASI|nr:hypothetical protein [Austropuccinia psidii MF-1]
MFEEFFDLKFLKFDRLSLNFCFLICSLILINLILKSNLKISILHPIILGRQSQFSRIRNQSQSPIITCSGATTGSLPCSPKRSINSLYQLLINSDGSFDNLDLQSNLPSDQPFKNLVLFTRQKLESFLNQSIQPNQNLLIYCSNPYAKLLFSLASLTLPFTTILASPNSSGSIPLEIQKVLEPYLSSLSLVIGDTSHEDIKELLGLDYNPKIITIQDLPLWFQNFESFPFKTLDNPTEFQKSKLLIINNDNQSNTKPKAPLVYQFTPDNLLAGITASLGLFPLNDKLNSDDRVALEFDNDNLWGYDMSLAAAALYSGASVAFFNRLKDLADWKPTVLSLQPTTSQTLANQIIQLSQSSFFTKLAIGRKLYALSNGALAGQLSQTVQWLGPKVRAIFTNGPISQAYASLIRACISAPFQRVYSHPSAAGPVLANQPYDFQMLQPLRSHIHCGPPSVNVECKVVNIPEPALINGDAWKGMLSIRGPSIGTELLHEAPQDSSNDKSLIQGGFYQLTQLAQALPNGTIKIHYPSDLGDD